MRKAGQPRFPPRGQPGPREGWPQQCPSGSLVVLGGEFQKLGFLPLLRGLLHPTQHTLTADLPPSSQ